MLGLAERPPAASAATAAFDRYLARYAAPPLVVALSGGGDSVALLLMAKAWADQAGRRVVAVTVDHGLQAAGAEWALWCADLCARVGVDHRTLAWTGDKPATGLPAKARSARHALIAEAARAAGAAVILMGHTADDRLEARRMREAGSTAPDPRAWSPCPAWPEGRGLFILRPLLDARRAALRAWLAERGETWIEDPANADPRFARARARAAGHDADIAPAKGLAAIDATPVRQGPAGELLIARSALRRPDGHRLLSIALLCAAGAGRPPRGEPVARLLARLVGAEAFTASLAGARVEADGDAVTVLREAGELARRGAVDIVLSPGQPRVWDGRFEIEGEGVARPLGGLSRRLADVEQARLREIGRSARAALPAIVDAAGAVTCPILAGRGRILPLARLLAAVGAIANEEATWRVANCAETPYIHGLETRRT